MFVSAPGSAVAMMAMGYYAAVIETKVSRRMCADIFEEVLSFLLPEVGKFGAPGLVTRLANDVNQVQLLIVMDAQVFVKSPILAAWTMTKISSVNGA